MAKMASTDADRDKDYMREFSIFLAGCECERERIFKLLEDECECDHGYRCKAHLISDKIKEQNG
jgi:hypothetical protein